MCFRLIEAECGLCWDVNVAHGGGVQRQASQDGRCDKSCTYFCA